ncbi:hypothetical protein ABL78_1800 [Leptomonas seymouri]|uniref:Uncharacterized protein n=1 Tax=Leptomonas seymouri TaxID=5684 RepID=A0A0N1PEN2_LEPSE|nr:hypothetical protein ABL78_1800 [Leptomonas seymouri]|eukprot:KPI89064.1 hypothetical protein ABL78_1800 [Leptomonas seymouri]
MPVILRLCVAIERAAPTPPLTTIPTHTHATAEDVAALSSSLMASAAVVHSEPEAAGRVARSAELTSIQRRDDVSPVSTTKNRKAAEGRAPDSTTTSSPPRQRHYGRHNPLHWFRRRDKKRSLSEASAVAKSAAPAQVSNTAAQPLISAAAATEGSQGADMHHRRASQPFVSITASHPQPSPTAPEAATAVSTPAPADTGAAEGGEVKPQRSLVWISLLLTPATTVKSILQQVQDTVGRRMEAKLCESIGFSGFSDSTPLGSFAAAQPRASNKEDASHGADVKVGAGASGGSTAALPTAQDSRPAMRSGSSDAAETAEWSLCVQGSDGVFHWVGSNQQYPNTAVLHAPFVMEACLESNMAFEADRQLQRKERRAQRKARRESLAGGNSQRASFATSGEASALEDLDSGSTDASSAVNEFSSQASTEGEGERGSSAGDLAGRRCRGGSPSSHRHPHPSHRRCTYPSSPGQTGKHDRKETRKGDDAGANRGREKTAGPPVLARKLRPSDMTANGLMKPSASEAKFAFLKGVVVPTLALKQRNSNFARRLHKLPLYIEVHVPREMRADPLDPTTTTPSLKAQPAPVKAEVPAASAPPPESTPAAVEVGSADTHRAPSVMSMDVDVDVDVDAQPGGSAPTTTSSFVLSASTLPCSSQQQEHTARTPSAVQGSAGAAADISQRRCTSSIQTPERFDGEEPTSTVEVHLEALTGLATHATALEGLGDDDDPTYLPTFEKEAWCRTADAAHVKGVHAEVLGRLAKEEDAARRGLAKAQRDYAEALVAYRAAAPPTPACVHRRPSTEKDYTEPVNVNDDAELTALMKRKVELRASVEAGRQAERQCERLTTLVECLEKELREREDRRALLATR